MPVELLIKGPSEASKTDPFWVQFQLENRELSYRYPNIKAERYTRSDGSTREWHITGPAIGVRIWMDLAAKAAYHCGYKGGFNGAVNWWLDELQGDHVETKTRKPRPEDERIATVLDSSGNLVGYKGHRQWAGETFLRTTDADLLKAQRIQKATEKLKKNAKKQPKT